MNKATHKGLVLSARVFGIVFLLNALIQQMVTHDTDLYRALSLGACAGLFIGLGFYLGIKSRKTNDDGT